MANTYTKSYGSVKFHKLDGTLLFDSTATYDLWTSKDTEPSPDVKWIRVDVPGADGAVDLSRALAGQVNYDQREIDLQFSGRKADHAAAVAFVRTMRAMLHGARLRITTVLTGLAGGYYIADCECDGHAYPDGFVTIDVHAVADPFIHTGTQTLALAASNEAEGDYAMMHAAPAALVAGAGRLLARMSTTYNITNSPKNANSGKLWCACGSGAASATNLFDLSNYSVACYDFDGSTSYEYDPAAGASGHDINSGAMSGSYKEIYVSALKRTGNIPDNIFNGGFPFLSGNSSSANSCVVAVYLSGKVTSVSNPSIKIVPHQNVLTTDEHGRPTSSVAIEQAWQTVNAITARSYDDVLVGYLAVGKCSLNEPVPINALEVQFHGITSPGLTFRLAAMVSSGDLPAHWPSPSIVAVPLDFGGTFARTYGKTDSARISPRGVVTSHLCALTYGGYTGYALASQYTTGGSIDGWLPSDAKMICMTVTNSYGEDCPVCLIYYFSYEIKTANGSNGSMRSTPSIVSDSGAYVEIDGKAMVVDGGTQELEALTIGPGAFVVRYATFNLSAATLKWEGGVL